jgi:hypothetical protein
VKRCIRAFFRGTFIFDDSPPEDVHFAPAKDFPRQLVRGDPLPIKAAGKDPESDIREVFFFVGKPVKNKAGNMEPPPNVEVVKAEKLAGPEPAWWGAVLPIPSDKKGTFDVSTQFVNGAGLSSVATIKIELVEPGSGGAPYTIELSSRRGAHRICPRIGPVTPVCCLRCRASSLSYRVRTAPQCGHVGALSATRFLHA